MRRLSWGRSSRALLPARPRHVCLRRVRMGAVGRIPRDGKTSKRDGPEIWASYMTAEACIKEVDAIWMHARIAGERGFGGQISRTAPTDASTIVQFGKKPSQATHRCLPDTVDPRGPKGK